jgi:hypothetical protein
VGKTGEDLGADLAELYEAGAENLPRLADQFEEAREWLEYIRVREIAWGHDADLGIGAKGVHGSFKSFVDAIVDHLKSTEKNLDDTGKALCYAAKDYAATDGAAKAEFDKRTKKVG